MATGPRNSKSAVGPTPRPRTCTLAPVGALVAADGSGAEKKHGARLRAAVNGDCIPMQAAAVIESVKLGHHRLEAKGESNAEISRGNRHSRVGVNGGGDPTGSGQPYGIAAIGCDGRCAVCTDGSGYVWGAAPQHGGPSSRLRYR